jgi:hypothetical protein
MATDGPTPPDCNDEIFKKGEPIAALDAPSNAAENWVQAVAKKANARLDWHYSGGRAQVLHLGDNASRKRVEEAITNLESTLKGRILRVYISGEPGLYRKDVTPTPEGAIAGFMGEDGNTAFMVEKKRK